MFLALQQVDSRRRYGAASRLDGVGEREHVTGYETTDWTPSLNQEAYGAMVGRVREYIAAGDTYQVNFTLRQHFRLDGDPQACYHDFCRSQKASYCAFMDTGRCQILSASPELFFELKQGVITCRPMKGTARRGRWLGEDETVKAQLQKVVDFWKAQKAELTPHAPLSASVGGLPENVPLKQKALWEEMESSDDDPLLHDAVDLIRREGRASVSMLQRRMRIGYTRAARLVDALEEQGVIGPAQPTSQVREVLDFGEKNAETENDTG